MADIISAKIARCILYATGWSLFNESQDIQKRLGKGKYVMAISHSSIWDALIFLAYKYAHPEVFSNSLIVVKPQIYEAVPDWVKNVLDNVGFIKATSYEEKNGGFVKASTEMLKEKKKFLFLISPKGAREKYPWRSGYYNIAKEMGCDICTCGLDYEKKKIVVFDPVSVRNKSKEEIEPILQKQMGSIVPLYPYCSEVDLRCHSPSNTSLLKVSFLLILLVLILIFLFIYNKKILLFFVVILLIFI